MTTEWVTHAEAAAIVGCSLQTIDRRQRAGVIARRYVADRKLPSLSRASVEAFAEQWRRAQLEKQQKASTRLRPSGGPPDDGDVWLDSTTASLVVGVTPQYLCRLAAEGRLPAARDKRRNKWWFRRRDVEQYAAVRAFERRQAIAS